MRRLPNGFYRDLAELRGTYGEEEYDRNHLVKAALPLLEKWLGLDAGDQLKSAFREARSGPGARRAARTAPTSADRPPPDGSRNATPRSPAPGYRAG
jgi:hypothetical protein